MREAHFTNMSTPQHEMENDDAIDVMIEQIGGGPNNSNSSSASHGSTPGPIASEDLTTTSNRAPALVQQSHEWKAELGRRRNNAIGDMFARAGEQALNGEKYRSIGDSIALPRLILRFYSSGRQPYGSRPDKIKSEL